MQSRAQPHTVSAPEVAALSAESLAKLVNDQGDEFAAKPEQGTVKKTRIAEHVRVTKPKDESRQL